MALENSKLEELHTEMKSLLSERQGELARSGDEDCADDVATCETLSDEIDAWEKKASDVHALPEVDSEEHKLEAEAREICTRIEAVRRV